MVLPLDAGIGQAPHSFANAASEWMRSGLSPTTSSISAAVPVAIPCAASSSEARAAQHRTFGMLCSWVIKWRNLAGSCLSALERPRWSSGRSWSGVAITVFTLISVVQIA